MRFRRQFNDVRRVVRLAAGLAPLVLLGSGLSMWLLRLTAPRRHRRAGERHRRSIGATSEVDG